MAKNPPTIEQDWIMQTMPIFLVVLIAVHVVALVYWIYRLATDHKRRTKPH